MYFIWTEKNLQTCMFSCFASTHTVEQKWDITMGLKENGTMRIRLEVDVSSSSRRQTLLLREMPFTAFSSTVCLIPDHESHTKHAAPSPPAVLHGFPGNAHRCLHPLLPSSETPAFSLLGLGFLTCHPSLLPFLLVLFPPLFSGMPIKTWVCLHYNYELLQMHICYSLNVITATLWQSQSQHVVSVSSTSQVIVWTNSNTNKTFSFKWLNWVLSSHRDHLPCPRVTSWFLID